MVVPQEKLKLERLRSGLALAFERKLATLGTAGRVELAAFFAKEHHLSLPLARRYAASVAQVAQAFPEGDVPDDVVQCHVEALALHDEEHARELLRADEHVVLVVKGAQTVVRRASIWLDEGDLLLLCGQRFRVTAVAREEVSRLDEEGARREGFSTLEDWRRAWEESRPRSADPNVAFRHELVAVREVLER